MEALAMAMSSSNERVGESASEGAKEKPQSKPEPTHESSIDTKKQTENQDEAQLDAEGDKAEVSASDFFSVNERRLGYKSRLSLAVRKALTTLEREASRQTGVSVDKLRAEFLLIQSERKSPFIEVNIRPEYLVRDYRTFLIFFITLIRRRNRST